MLHTNALKGEDFLTDSQRVCKGLPPRAVPTMVPPPPAPRPASPPLATIEILDAEAVRAIDPLFPKLFPLWSTLTEAAELREGEHVIARVAPTDAGQRAASDLSTEGYELLDEQLGTDDTGEIDERFATEGEAAMRAVLADMPRGALQGWRGEPATRTMQAEAVGRWYGMPAEAIAAITGRPYAPRKSLLPTCGKARDLAERKRVAEAAEAEAQASAQVVAAEAARPKTLHELGAEMLEVKKHRVGARRDPITRLEIVDPFEGAAMFLVGETDAAAFYVWRAPAGLELPTLDADGVRVLRRDETPPIPVPKVFDATVDALEFIRELRARFGSYDTGPMTQWSDRGVEKAKALAAANASRLSTMPGPHARVRGWLCEAVVRGLRVRVDLGAAIIAEAAERAALGMTSLAMPRHVRQTDAGESDRAMGFELDRDRAMAHYTTHEREFLLQSAGRAEIEALCVRAAQGGGISAGALLDEQPTAATKTKKGGR